MGQVDILIIWCYITLSLLPGIPGLISQNIKGSLTRTFVVSGLSLSFYKSWKMPKVAEFPHQMVLCTCQWLVSNRRLPAPSDLGTSRRPLQGNIELDGSWWWLVLATSTTHIHLQIKLILGAGCSARVTFQRGLTAMPLPRS